MPSKEEGTTKVRFELWAVLGLMITAAVFCFTYLNAEQRDTRTKQQEVITRVVKLEANQDHIIKALDKIMVSVEKIDSKLETHRAYTEKTKREVK